MQLSLFETLPSSLPPASPIIGLKVRLPQACRCGSTFAVIGSSCGPHEHRLGCEQCGRWRRWLGRSEADFVTTVCAKFGAPTTPIFLRTGEGVS
jgi:hypothetical protein